MNIYEKLQQARNDFHATSLKKTGQNKFAHYSYFELADFLPTILKVCTDNKIFSNISFNQDLATLTITDTDKPEDKITFTSPMSKANLKGCHEVQNLGAVETYIRRYLYTTAFEIIENDILDNTQDVKGLTIEPTITKAQATALWAKYDHNIINSILGKGNGLLTIKKSQLAEFEQEVINRTNGGVN